MKRLISFFILNSLISCCTMYSQELISSEYLSSEKVKKYRLIDATCAHDRIMFTLKDDYFTEVGFSYDHGMYGFWNNQIDTFALNDTTIIIFNNPYPDLVLTKVLWKGDDDYKQVKTNAIQGIHYSFTTNNIFTACPSITDSTGTKVLHLFFENSTYSVVASDLFKEGKRIQRVSNNESILDIDFQQLWSDFFSYFQKTVLVSYQIIMEMQGM